MAPLDQSRRNQMEELKPRVILVEHTPLPRRRDIGSNNNGGKRDNGNDRNGGNKAKDNNGAGKNSDDPKNFSQDESFPTPLPSAAAITTTTASPTTVFVVSSTTPTSIPPVLSVVIPSSSIVANPVPTTNSSLTSLLSATSISTPTSSSPSITLFTSDPENTSQPRKGVPDDSTSTDGETRTATASKTRTWQPTTPVPDLADQSSATATTISPPQQIRGGGHHNKNSDGGLSPAAEKALIAAGTIGAFIIICAAVWFISRCYKRDLLARFRGREFRRGGSHDRYGLRKKSRTSSFMEPPPEYKGHENHDYPVDEKSPKPEEDYFTPPDASSLAPPPAVATSPQRKEEVFREALSTVSSMNLPKNATQAFYGQEVSQPKPQPSATDVYYNQGYEGTGTLTSTQGEAFLSSGFQGGTMRSIQTQNVYDPQQREVNHLSYLSSLSSGFGDGLIIPEPAASANPNASKNYRQSKTSISQFSWERSSLMPSRPTGDRDTIYTNSSEETPRFRTINSWVAQQTGRVERQQGSDKEIPSMPEIPASMQSSEPQRKPSDISAFMQHPGDEVDMGRGFRVPSEILDRKFGG